MIVRIEYFALQKGMGAKSNKENPMLASKEPVTRCFIKRKYFFQFALQENENKMKMNECLKKKKL